ncbi:MAG: hypothetical protein ACT4NX_03480 [Deltaproteobacteria bacterium]
MKITALLIAALILLASCANAQRVSSVIDPKRVNKEKIQSAAVEITPVGRFNVAIPKGLSGRKVAILGEIDRQFLEFSRCRSIADGGETARGFLISVVDGTFECKYHGGRCNGEYDPTASLIIVTYKAFNREGTLPLLKHEWAHAYGFLNPDDSNLDELRPCTKY